jgi:transcriptional regulator with XRE-family HTH domain
MAHIGERIKQIRVGKRLTQTQLASKLGTSQRAISQYETGKWVPNAEFVEKLIKILEIDEPVWLIMGSGKEVGESRPPYQSSGGDSSESLVTLIPKAIEILESKGVYSQALAANINAFLHALRSEKENLARLAALEKREGSKDEVPSAIAVDPKTQ